MSDGSMQMAATTVGATRGGATSRKRTRPAEAVASGRRMMTRQESLRVASNWMRSYAKCQAEKTIKRFMLTARGRSTKLISASYCQHGPTLDDARAIRFEDLSAKLRMDTLIDVSAEMLMRIIQLINWQRTDRPYIVGTVNVKIFLAAFMIATRPEHVFETMEELENRVLDASTPLLTAFHDTAHQLAAGASWNDVRKTSAMRIAELLCTYLRTFKQWKIVDERKLAGRLRHALLGLEAADKNLQHEEPNSRMRSELRSQIGRLREKLALIAGDEELAAYDKHQRQVNQRATVSRTNGTVDPPTAAHTRMSNVQLGHEMLLDRKYRLFYKAMQGTADDILVVQTTIRQLYERSFWESVIEELSQAVPCYTRVIKILAEIRAGAAVLGPNSVGARGMAALIDVDIIEQQLANGAISYKDCETLIDSMVTVVVAMHTHTKNAQNKADTIATWDTLKTAMQTAGSQDQGQRARAMCDALEFVLDRLHVVRVDEANIKIVNIYPVIVAHGVAYECNHFTKLLQQGMTPTLTVEWIEDTVLLQRTNTRDLFVFADIISGNADSIISVHTAAIVNLMADYPNWGGKIRSVEDDSIPETMRLDLLRVKALNYQFRIGVVATVIRVTANQLVRQWGQNAQACKDLLGVIDNTVTTNPPHPGNPRALVKMVIDDMAAAGVDHAMLTSAEHMLEKNVQCTSPVYIALAKHVKTGWYYTMFGGTVPSTINLPDGVMTVLLQSREYLLLLGKVANLNRNVHVVHYNTIIKAAAAKAMQ